MATTDAEDTALVCYNGSAELRNVEGVVESNPKRILSINVPKIDILGSPLKVVNKFVRAVVLLENEGVMEKLTKLFNYVNLRIVRYAAIKFAQLSHFKNQVLRNLLQLSSDELKCLKVPLVSVLFQKLNIFLQLVELFDRLWDFHQDTFLTVFAVLEISQSFLLKVTIDE